MSSVLRALSAIAAPAGSECRLLVFYFHRIPAEPDPLLPYEPDARIFDRMLAWIGAQFRVLDPLEACDRLFDGTLPARPAIVTFDDGYRDNCGVALPILQRHAMPAAFFVATAFLEGGAMMNDRVIEAVRRCEDSSIQFPGGRELLPLRNAEERRDAIDRILGVIKRLPAEEQAGRVRELEAAVGVAVPTRMMMRPEDVTALHRLGMRVGGHTRTHPILARLDDAAAEREIVGGLEDLAEIIGERPQLFAYPNGKRGDDFDARHVGMVARAGVRYAFTTEPGVAKRGSETHELPRFAPWGRTWLRFGVHALRHVFGPRAD